jgi:ubiquinone/menaquinone biosynthesis C-methylase UbiE
VHVPLDAEAARRVYDRIGRVQDSQRFYEDAATGRLVELGRLASARSIFELGCGTGRFAAGLLGERLDADARYLGVDVSRRMVALSANRLRRWAPRAEVLSLEPPATELPGTDSGFDRFVAAYVFDLLAEDHARELLAEARRLVEPSGLLCVAGLTGGVTRRGRLIAGAWGAVARRAPAVLGGCRPIEVASLLDRGAWRVRAREVVESWGVPSEVLVASSPDR